MVDADDLEADGWPVEQAERRDLVATVATEQQDAAAVGRPHPLQGLEQRQQEPGVFELAHGAEAAGSARSARRRWPWPPHRRPWPPAPCHSASGGSATRRSAARPPPNARGASSRQPSNSARSRPAAPAPREGPAAVTPPCVDGVGIRDVELDGRRPLREGRAQAAGELGQAEAGELRRGGPAGFRVPRNRAAVGSPTPAEDAHGRPPAREGRAGWRAPAADSPASLAPRRASLRIAIAALYDLCMTANPGAGHARRLVHGLAGAWRRLEARAAPAMRASAGLDLDDFVFLETVAMTDLAPGEIAAALRIPPHGVSRRLAALESAGLVRRTLDPEDHRRRVLSVTPHGHTVLAAAHAALEARVAPMLREIGPERSAAVLDALTRLAAGLDPEDEGAGATAQATPDAR